MGVEVEKGYLSKVSVKGGNFGCDVYIENGRIRGVSVFPMRGDALSLLEFAVSYPGEFEHFIDTVIDEIGEQTRLGGKKS